MQKTGSQRGFFIKWIIALSIFIPVIVTILMILPAELKSGTGWTKYLPHLNGTLNSITTLILIMGLIFIKNNKIQYHRYAMLTAFVLGIIFLISYVIYHATNPSTVYGDTNGNGTIDPEEAVQLGALRTFYIILLLSHILLAIIVVPLVLLALYYALYEKFPQHKKVVKFAYPIWLYVSITGVLVYLLIRPYY